MTPTGWRILAGMLATIVIGGGLLIESLSFGVYANGVHFGQARPKYVALAALGHESPTGILMDQPSCFGDAANRSTRLDTYSPSLLSCEGQRPMDYRAGTCSRVLIRTAVTRLAPLTPVTERILVSVAGTPAEIGQVEAALRSATDWPVAGTGEAAPLIGPSQTVQTVTCDGYGIIKIEKEGAS